VAIQLKMQAAQVLEQISALSRRDPVALQKQIDDLRAANTSKSFILFLAHSFVARSYF
jgi:hypothetical protein